MPSGFHNRALGGGGGLAGGERRPEEVYMWHGSVIGLTTRRLVVVAWPEVAPRRAAEARSRRCAHCGSGFGEARGREDQCAAMGARG
jgi:hypothetical protein